MNATQRKYLIKRVEELRHATIHKLEDQTYSHFSRTSTIEIIKRLKNWRPLNKKEILKAYADNDYDKLRNPIVYNEDEYLAVEKIIKDEREIKNEVIYTSINKVKTETTKVTDVIMIGNETEALKVLEDFTKFINKF